MISGSLGLRELVYLFLKRLSVSGSCGGRESGSNRRWPSQRENERQNRDGQGCDTNDALQLHEKTSAL